MLLAFPRIAVLSLCATAVATLAAGCTGEPGRVLTLSGSLVGKEGDVIRRQLERFRQTHPSQLRLCSVVKSELIYGARKSHRVADNLRLLTTFFGPLQSLPFDDSCAAVAGAIRAELARSGQPIGPNDSLIAATAVNFKCTLVTHNTKEFDRVPELFLVDWET